MNFAGYHLEVEALACRRGLSAIFEGVTFHLAPGSVLAVRGPNGSGKSTLLRVIGGLMKPSAGAVSLADGGSPVEEIESRVHYVGHLPAVTAALTVTENLEFQTALLGSRAASIASILARAGLSDLSKVAARQLSAGQRKRLALARLMAVPRPLWLLDEPAESLDAEGERLLTAICQEHLLQGGMTIVATHGEAPVLVSAELRLEPAVARLAS